MSRFEAWRNAVLADIQPFLKHIRICYIRLHYKPFFKDITEAKP